MILAVAFFVLASLYSAVGHGGASGYLAAMALVGVAPTVMRPTALVLNVVVASIAVVHFARAGHFSLTLLWPFALGSIPLAFVGGGIQLPGEAYKALVGVILVIAAVRLWMETVKSSEERRPLPVFWAIGAGAGIGLLSGLTGTGGGIFLSPLLLFTRWSATRESGGVSAAFILVNSVAGLAGNLAATRYLPAAMPGWVLAVVAGGMIGSFAGSRRVQPLTFRRVLAVVLLMAGGKLAFESLGRGL
jgi:uncharacterized membrane protein YfcA